MREGMRTSLEAVHGEGVAARGEDLAHLSHLGVVRAVQLFAHEEALLEVLQRLKRLALLLHCGIHLVMLPQPPLQVIHIVRCHHIFFSRPSPSALLLKLAVGIL